MGEIYFRDTSCVCDEGFLHTGHDLKFASIAKTDKETKTQTKKKRKKSNVDSKQDCDNTEHGQVLVEEISASQFGNSTSCSPDEDVGSKTHLKRPRKTKKNDIGVKDHKTPQTCKGIPDREQFFANALNALGNCKSFDEIVTNCSSLSNAMPKDDVTIPMHQPSIMNTGLHVNEDALQIWPTDIPQDCILYPVKVGADGNCLPYTRSILAFGNQDRAAEIRVKIIVEAVLYIDLYLSQVYLRMGIETANKDLAKIYAFYSDEYEANITRTQDQITEIYKKEVLKITKDKSSMGIWQIFALSSVLKRPIFSVYPNLGNPSVRKDLHRVILPRQTRSPSMTYVMWTTTRTDMVENHWIPNHFVALLPFLAHLS